MSKSDSPQNLGALSSKVYELLNVLEPDERTKVLNAVAQLFGNATNAQLAGHGTSSLGSEVARVGLGVQPTGVGNAQEFFAQKNPENKGEMLAVAARYLEQNGPANSLRVDDFASFFVEARQNFDRRNFVRDMKNAQNRAGLFNKGMGKGQYQLSYFGQQYVDALPNREALKNLKRPTRRGAVKRKQAKKGSENK